MNRERLAAQLLVTFVGELEEQVRQMNADLLALEATPTAAEPMRSVFRVAHTLKGAARAAGVPAIESACHALESMLIPVRDGQRPITAEEFAHLFRAADALADAGERLRRGEDLTGGGLARLAGEVAGVPAATAPPPPARPAATVAEPEAAAMPVAPRASSGRGAVRVEEAKLEALFAAASELSTAVASVGELGDDLRALGAAAEACSVRWRRVQRRLRLAAERASTSSELRRELDSLDEAVTTLVEDASRAARRGKQDAHALAGASAELTRHVYGLHTRPLADGLEPLPRLVRDLATAAGKSVRLETSGGEVEADRAVLDALREPVVHLVRNAVDHGIESPDVRARRGKSTRGRVSVSALVLGDRLVVQVQDDGAGVDVDRLRARLTALGRPADGDERALARTLFESGISTRAEATEISGRGVGLDIVRSAVERLKGSVDATWTPGGGTTVTIECPLSLATLRGVVTQASGQLFVVPNVHVDRVLRVTRAEVAETGGRAMLRTPDGPVPLVGLARLLGPPLGHRPLEDVAPAILLRSGPKRLALLVDALVAEQEVIVRHLPDVGRPAPHITGAAILGSGRVALVVNTLSLLDAGTDAGATVTAQLAPSVESKRRASVLVVDDSITTRTLEQSVLEAAGYQVLTAVDGADAWRMLQERSFDLVVADVEMPRMDGFALCRAIRASKRMGETPVVLVTALESAEHRARGLEAGADAYVGKSSFDQQHLLDVVRELLAS